MAQEYLSHFIFNSDYPMDKIVFYKQVEVTVPAGQDEYKIDIPHNLLFTPLPIAVWAFNSDFSDAMSERDAKNEVELESLTADSTNISVTFDDEARVTSIKVYLRVYGLLPETAIDEAAPTARQASKLILNTDKIYSPLIFSGIITTDFNQNHVAKINVTNGYKELVTQANRIEVEHNLGDYPYILYWRENNGVITRNDLPSITPGYPLQFYNYSEKDKCGFYCGQSDGQDKWYIRIYANV